MDHHSLSKFASSYQILIVVSGTFLIFIFGCLNVFAGFYVVQSTRQEPDSILAADSLMKGVQWFPLDSKFVKNALLKNSENPSRFENLLRITKTFHKEDPEIMIVLGLNATVSPETTQTYLQQAAKFAPKNSSLFFLAAQRAAKNNDSDLAYSYFKKAINLGIEQTRRSYPDLDIPKEVHLFDQQISSEINASYLSLIQKSPLPDNPQLFNAHLTKIVYYMGLLAKNTDNDLTARLWLTATYLSPAWSYFHIELANYYLVKKQPHQAEQQMSVCLQLTESYAHCKWFEDNFVLKNLPQEVGFLEKKIQLNFYF